MALSAEAAARIRRRIAYLREHAAHLVIDGDVHPSDHSALPPAVRERLENDPNYYHGRPLLSQNLVAKMNQAGVDVALCWQNPAVLPYGDDPDDNAARLTASNERIAKLAQEHPQRVIPAGWTDPKALGTGNAITLARRCVEDFAMPVSR